MEEMMARVLTPKQTFQEQFSGIRSMVLVKSFRKVRDITRSRQGDACGGKTYSEAWGIPERFWVRALNLGDIIRGVRKFDGLTGHITISVGRKRNSELSIQNTTELIEELDGNRNGIKSAKIKMKDDEKGRMEIVDLFEDVLHDYIPFEIEVKKNLDFVEEHRAMLNCYKNRIEEIRKLTKMGV